MSRFIERAVTFACGTDALVGIVHQPTACSDLGVLVVVGGPQYRVGSHRQFVLLCRALAEAGFASLRFDVRGMGDSGGAAHAFEDIAPDIGAAIDALQAQVPSVRRVALWGLCDGASAALLYLDSTADARVQGLCLLNPWVRSPQSLAQTRVRHYYTARLAERSFWMKLLSGRVGAEAWRGFTASLQARRAVLSLDAGLTYQQRMARAWARFPGRLLLVLSGNDLTAKEFIDASGADTAWAGALRHPRLRRHELPDADHTFSASASQCRIEALTVEWARAFTAPAPQASQRDARFEGA